MMHLHNYQLYTPLMHYPLPANASGKIFENYNWLQSGSIATVMADVFQKNGIMVSRKLAKIVRIFVDIEHIKTEGSYIVLKELYW